MRTAERTLLAWLAAAALAALAACGDSPGPAPETPAAAPAVTASQAVPPSAVASTRAFAQYVGTLGANDRSDPLDVSQASPPTSETEEPEPLT